MKILSVTLMTIFFLFISIPAFAIPANSDTEPAKYTKCRGLMQVVYDVKQVDITDMDGKTRKVWTYEYVEIEGPITKAKFKEALRHQDLTKRDGTPWTPDEAVVEYIEEKLAAEVPKK